MAAKVVQAEEIVTISAAQLLAGPVTLVAANAGRAYFPIYFSVRKAGAPFVLTTDDIAVGHISHNGAPPSAVLNGAGFLDQAGDVERYRFGTIISQDGDTTADVIGLPLQVYFFNGPGVAGGSDLDVTVVYLELDLR